MERQIVYLPARKITPHPDNPRKDLGELGELAESIKANGILQNLTVVPIENLYRVVIGHRRLAAAKLAGLEEVPCIISDMSPKDQVSTMLLENMQRSDLTLYEQAQGFQMLLNFGETGNEISQKTGFSETTVRRRVKLLELDPEKFKASAERGATLMDYGELGKIKDPELKNKVLGSIGTSNFNYELRRALNQEKLEENKAIWLEALEKFATEYNGESVYADGLKSIALHNAGSNVDELKVPEDADSVEYFYSISTYGHVVILTKNTDADSKTQQEDEQRKRAIGERKAALEILTERAFECRRDFIKNYNGKKKMFPALLEFWLRILFDACRYGEDFNFALYQELMGYNLEEDQEFQYENIENEAKADPERVFLLSAYCISGDYKQNGYFGVPWHKWPAHKENKALDALYDALGGLGYQMSDEERALMTGEHELFKENG